MSEENEMKLKPCPFCGGNEITVDSGVCHYHICNTCDAYGPSDFSDKGINWNSRGESALDELYDKFADLVIVNTELKKRAAKVKVLLGAYDEPEARVADFKAGWREAVEAALEILDGGEY